MKWNKIKQDKLKKTCAHTYAHTLMESFTRYHVYIFMDYSGIFSSFYIFCSLVSFLRILQLTNIMVYLTYYLRTFSLSTHSLSLFHLQLPLHTRISALSAGFPWHPNPSTDTATALPKTLNKLRGIFATSKLSSGLRSSVQYPRVWRSPLPRAILSNQQQHVRAASSGILLRLFVFSPFLFTVAARWAFFPLTPAGGDITSGRYNPFARVFMATREQQCV